MEVFVIVVFMTSPLNVTLDLPDTELNIIKSFSMEIVINMLHFTRDVKQSFDAYTSIYLNKAGQLLW